MKDTGRCAENCYIYLTNKLSCLASGYMKESLRDFFTFSTLERKGIMVLIILMLIITGINFYLAHDEPTVKPRDNRLLEKELQAFERQLQFSDSIAGPPPDFPPEPLTVSAELFYFDPNEVSAGDLRRLGLSGRLSKNLIQYRNHGGRFRQKEDLKKIYGMSAQLYAQLSPYVKIKEKFASQLYKPPFYPPAGTLSFNINLADSMDFEGLSGIGPVLARRIVRYRTLLGGFYDTGQLKEVYGISDSLYLSISARLFTDTTMIVKLNLNEAVENDLARHPYIGKYTARGIIRYRARVHTIKSLDELTANGILSVEAFERLKKYLSI